MTARSALPGEQYGRLTVTDVKDGRRRVCRCTCGSVVTVERSNLTSDNTRSCGCLKRELEAERPVTHGRTRGGSRDKLSRIWHNMIQRCTNPNNPAWEHYGGRGITVCDRWLSLEAFATDMGEPPAGLTLDRIDNDGPYAPDNCRWAPRTTQARNRRSARVLAFNGESRSLAEWAEETGIPYWTLHARLRRGWSVERTLTEKN